MQSNLEEYRVLTQMYSKQHDRRHCSDESWIDEDDNDRQKSAEHSGGEN